MLSKISREVFIEEVYQFLINPSFSVEKDFNNFILLILDRSEKNRPEPGFIESLKLELNPLFSLFLEKKDSFEGILMAHLENFEKVPKLIQSILLAFLVEQEFFDIESLKQKNLINKYIRYCNSYCFLEESKVVHAVLLKTVSGI